MTSTSAAIDAIWEKVHSPEGLAFPETVGALTELGVTRYRVDYAAQTLTAYLDGADAHVSRSPWKHELPASTKLDVAALGAAIRGAQAGTIGGYHGFSTAAVAAGVTDYTCCIAGQRVVYTGALGDVHTEWFPGAKKD